MYNAIQKRTFYLGKEWVSAASLHSWCDPGSHGSQYQGRGSSPDWTPPSRSLQTTTGDRRKVMVSLVSISTGNWALTACSLVPRVSHTWTKIHAEKLGDGLGMRLHNLQSLDFYHQLQSTATCTWPYRNHSNHPKADGKKQPLYPTLGPSNAVLGFQIIYWATWPWGATLVYHICLLVADAIMKGLGRHPFHRQLGTPPDPVVVGTVDIPC